MGQSSAPPKASWHDAKVTPPFPAIEPYAQHRLDVGCGHSIYVEECGHPNAKAALALHSGPGSGCTSGMRRFFDPVRYRDHARVELAIRDLKEGAGLEHCPLGKFFANAAWLGCAVLAHDLVRWTARFGAIRSGTELTVACTVRKRVLSLRGRLVNRSGHLVLRLPERWPWAASFTMALERIRSLPLVV